MNKLSKICARCRRPFMEPTIRHCYNEAVNREMGEDICYFCCKRCRFHTSVPLCGAIGCSYKKGAQRL